MTSATSAEHDDGKGDNDMSNPNVRQPQRRISLGSPVQRHTNSSHPRHERRRLNISARQQKIKRKAARRRARNHPFAP